MCVNYSTYRASTRQVHWPVFCTVVNVRLAGSRETHLCFAEPLPVAPCVYTAPCLRWREVYEPYEEWHGGEHRRPWLCLMEKGKASQGSDLRLTPKGWEGINREQKEEALAWGGFCVSHWRNCNVQSGENEDAETGGEENTDLQNQRGRPGSRWRPQRPGLSSLGSGAEPDRRLVAATIDEPWGTSVPRFPHL